MPALLMPLTCAPDHSAGLALLMIAGLLVVLFLLLPWWATALAVAITVLPLLLILRQARQALRLRVLVGVESLPGACAIVVARVSQPVISRYVVRVRGELWSAWSPDDLAVGSRSLVLEAEGNRLVVCRMPPELEGLWSSSL